LSIEYERYLERLNQIVSQEVVPKMAIFDYFTKHIYTRGEDPNSIEPLMWYVQSGLTSDITFSLFRLIDRGSDRNIYHFLTHTEQHLARISWKTPLTLAAIEEQRDSLVAVDLQIANLRKRRNKLFGHYDKEFFYEPDNINVCFPFSSEDAKSLIRTLQMIISAHMYALKGTASVSIDGFAYAAAEKLYTKLRDHRAT
jgi:hypothetical protein